MPGAIVHRHARPRVVRRPLLALVSAILCAAALPPHLAAQDCDSARVRSLPVVERPASVDTGGALVVLLTGDGGWANADEAVARGLLARGAAVVGLNMRSYLSHKKSPDAAASDVACLVSRYLVRWNRQRFMLLGYSRGADVAPFVATRLPTALREQLTMVALVSPAQSANFQFHLIDLVRDVSSEDDVPVMPELEKLRGTPLLCIYGREDAGTVCPLLPSNLARVVVRDGGHRLTGGFEVVAEELARGLGARGPPTR